MATSGNPSIKEALDLAATSIKQGNVAEGKAGLEWVIKREPQNVLAWLWMTRCVTNTQEKLDCYRKVLAIDPSNEHALKGISLLTQRQPAPTDSPERKPRPWMLLAVLVLGIGTLCGVLLLFGVPYLQPLIGQGAASAAPTSITQIPDQAIAAAIEQTQMVEPTSTPPPADTPTPKPTNTRSPSATPRPTSAPTDTPTPDPVFSSLDALCQHVSGLSDIQRDAFNQKERGHLVGPWQGRVRYYFPGDSVLFYVDAPDFDDNPSRNVNLSFPVLDYEIDKVYEFYGTFGAFIGDCGDFTIIVVADNREDMNHIIAP